MTEQERYEIMVDEIIELKNKIKQLQTENEDIKFLYENLKEEHLETIKTIKHIKVEAYKECIAKVKELHDSPCCYDFEKSLDNLLREMAGRKYEQD